MGAVASRRREAGPAGVKGARRAAWPGFIEPCHPSLHSEAPETDDWLHEIKADGYRVQIHLRHEGVRIFTREGLDWTDQYPFMATAAAKVPVRDAILDGEAIVTGERGVADLQALRRELGKRNSQRLTCNVFDLLYLD